MGTKFHPQIVTANDLFEGDVVYWTKDGEWSRHHSKAQVSSSGEQADDMLAKANRQQDKVVGPYLVNVKVDEEGIPHPAHFREVFRTTGPSNYFHGKQAD